MPEPANPTLVGGEARVVESDRVAATTSSATTPPGVPGGSPGPALAGHRWLAGRVARSAECPSFASKVPEAQGVQGR